MSITYLCDRCGQKASLRVTIHMQTLPGKTRVDSGLDIDLCHKHAQQFHELKRKLSEPQHKD